MSNFVKNSKPFIVTSSNVEVKEHLSEEKLKESILSKLEDFHCFTSAYELISLPQSFLSAEDFLHNHDLAKQYIKQRSNDALKLINMLIDRNGVLDYCIISFPLENQSNKLLGVFLSSRKVEKVIPFDSMECCLAYILARYW